MAYKTIKISEENYRWLLKLASIIQSEKGKLVSFDDAISEIKNEKIERKKDKLMSLAGSWKMSDKEALKLIDEIYKERKIISHRL
mgnify:CR=1 FL=1